MSDFVAYWDGSPLGPLERLSLKSFVDRGHSIALTSYQSPSNVPAGVELIDARDFMALDSVVEQLLRANAYSKVSDLLRYRILSSVPWTWVDTDIVLLAGDLPRSEFLFGYESDRYINTAVLRISPSSELIQRLLSETTGLSAEEVLRQPHAAYAPQLLTRVVAELGLTSHAQPRDVLYPIHYTDVWRLFAPREREWCHQALDGAASLHLWNEMIRRAGFRDSAPPRGSFLSELFTQHAICSNQTPVSITEVKRWAARIDKTQRTLLNRTSRQVRKFVARRIRPVARNALDRFRSMQGQLFR